MQSYHYDNFIKTIRVKNILKEFKKVGFKNFLLKRLLIYIETKIFRRFYSYGKNYYNPCYNLTLPLVLKLWANVSFKPFVFNRKYVSVLFLK